MIKKKVVKTTKKLSKEKNQNKLSTKILGIFLIKITLIFLILGIYFFESEENFSNKISLLAVNENSEGEIVGGSLIDLKLEVKPGNGQIYVNSKTLKEVDTQLSISNSNKLSCQLFNLDCNSYDFFYSFEGESLILKGPSASAAIAIITAKTLNLEKVDQNVVITGSLNSGGVVGIVGGVEEKINVAQSKGFSKILVPYFSIYNQSEERDIEIVKALDIIDAYNEFGGKKYELETKEFSTKEYDKLMGSLSSKLCARTNELFESINGTYEENSTLNSYLTRAKENFNSSQIASERGSYYSSGSFCFSANNFLKSIQVIESNLSTEDLEEQMRKFEYEINLKFVEINSKEYRKNNIQTINDLYVLLLLNDRVHEAKEFIENSLEEKNTLNEILNQSNSSLTNVSKPVYKKENLAVTFAYSKERMQTVSLWEEFLAHQGKRVIYDEELMKNACRTLSNQITLKSGVLEQYNFFLFEEMIETHNEYRTNPIFTNLCVYNALELNGRIDTVLSSFGDSSNSTEDFSQKLFELTKSRLALNSNGNFPLIPFIYFDYAEELYTQKSYPSSLLYTNYALSFGNLDLYLKEEKTPSEVLQNSFNQILDHPLFILGILLIIGFL